MEKYIKPECKIVEVKFEGNLMQASNIPPVSDTDLGWNDEVSDGPMPVSYTHLRAHETT